MTASITYRYFNGCRHAIWLKGQSVFCCYVRLCNLVFGRAPAGQAELHSGTFVKSNI